LGIIKLKGLRMRVLIDGNEAIVNSIKVIWEDPILLDGTPREDGSVQMDINSEGVIIDVYDQDGEPHRTTSRDPQELLDLTH